MIVNHFYPVMVGTGILAGFMSGLFGIGGGVIVTPLLVMVYPMLSGEKLGIEIVTGLSSAQGFFSSAVSYILHRKKNRPNWKIVKNFALPMALANFTASLLAGNFSERIILFTFGLLGLMSLVVTFSFKEPVKIFCEKNTLYLPLVGILLGILCGLAGQGGGFIYLPVLIYVFGAQIKQAISTSAAIGIIGSSGALFGRINGDLSFVNYTFELIGGIVIGGYVGAVISNRLNSDRLKVALNIFIFICSVQLIAKIFY
jgi:uncharacterized membrane protein YfcA